MGTNGSGDDATDARRAADGGASRESSAGDPHRLLARPKQETGRCDRPATYRGTRDLGGGILTSAIVGVVIPAGFAKPTTGKYWPLEVAIPNITKGKHT